MAGGALLRKSLQRVGRAQLQELVQSIARALGPRGELQGVGSDVRDSDLRRERIELSANASSSGSPQADAFDSNSGYMSRRRAKRLMKEVQYRESVLHVTGTRASESRRRRSALIVAEEETPDTGSVVVVDHQPLETAEQLAVSRRIVPLEPSRAGVSDSILRGHFHLPPPWGAGTARPLNRKKFSTLSERGYSSVAACSEILSESRSSLTQNAGVLLPTSDHGVLQVRTLAAKAKRDKKKKGGAKVAWDQDEGTGQALEVGGSGGADVERAEPEFDVEERMESALGALQREFSKLRTGRASPEMLDHIMVDAYGTQVPLNRVGTVSVLSPQMLSITPFDQNLLKAIEKGVRASPMELNPQAEGSAVLVPVPTLTQEVRQSMIKVVTKLGETAKLSIRRARKDALDSVKRTEDSMPEDEIKREEKKVDELTKVYGKRIDEACSAKGKEMLGG